MSETTLAPATQALYRFFDEAGDLLYVGISLNPLERWNQHRLDKPWWGEVRTATIEVHDSREAVEEAERAAIRREHPRYNIRRGGMVKRTVYVQRETWDKAKALGGANISDIVRELVEGYVRRGGRR